MLKIALVVVALIVGFGTGVWYDRYLMRGECAAGVGQWTGTICVNSDLLQ